MSEQSVLVSHRRHDLPLAGAHLELDRAIAPGFILRRATLRGLVQDERVTKATLGVDCRHPRARFVVVLAGHTDEFMAGDHVASLRPGDLLVVPDDRSHTSRTDDGDVLELECDADFLDAPSSENLGAHPSDHRARATKLHLGPRALTRVAEIATRLRDPLAGGPRPVGPLLRAFAHELRAAGARVAVDRLEATREGAPAEKAIMGSMDAALSALERSPMLVDLESVPTTRSPTRSTPRAEGGVTRRTLNRRIRSVHDRYALLGRGNGQWRGIRDAYRLVVATIALTHVDATPRSVARMVGYGSVEALDHAFHGARLPSPGATRRLALATV